MRLLHALTKDFSPFWITTHERDFRMPQALSTQPFIVDMPSRTGGAWPSTRYGTLAFNLPGTIAFSAIDVTCP